MNENTGPTANHNPRSSNELDTAPHQRWRADLRGIVQGVGFRPFVYRLAQDCHLTGWIRNDQHGVSLEVEGEPASLERFFARLSSELPPSAQLAPFTPQPVRCTGEREFVIRHQDVSGNEKPPPTAAIMPDLAPCSRCLEDVIDPTGRRRNYPFTNCTQCGPRFSIVESLPYDRDRTTMRHFDLCLDCRHEYEHPLDRRFHAQPNACPQCGPQLAWWDPHGKSLADTANPLAAAAEALATGKIVALKGVGGFQLLCDATDSAAVVRLRERKGRPTKPLAIMVRSVKEVDKICHVSRAESELLCTPAAPIVLLARRPRVPEHDEPDVAEEVAPGQRRLGLMLPSSPLHALLLQLVDFPIVATSGNLHSEPICIDNEDAVTRLNGIADFFLVHNRPIARPVDDSVAVVWEDEPRVWRRARGYAPLPLSQESVSMPMLALGGDQKSTFAFGIQGSIILSQHLGDLDSEQGILAYRQVLQDFLKIYSARPEIIAHDAHPHYQTTWIARELQQEFPSAQLLAVQHHHAHFAACLAEHHVPPSEKVLGIIWDGTGFGPDGTIWGGEFLVGNQQGYRRTATWRSFPLLGGKQAVHQPRRVTLALLWQILGIDVWRTPLGQSFSAAEQQVLERMLTAGTLGSENGTGAHSVATSSMGRLFDGLAALLDPQRPVHYSGEAAIALEELADVTERGIYSVELTSEETSSDISPAISCSVHRAGHPGEPFPIRPKTEELVTTSSMSQDVRMLWRLDWRPLFAEAYQDLARGTARSIIAARFHNTLVATILAVSVRVGLPRVALSGGCFQNQRLTQSVAGELRRAGFDVLLHRHVPPNDGGLSFGQLAVAAANR